MLLLASFLCACVFLALILGLFKGFLAFDGLLRIQYERHRSAWLADGKPAGITWIPPESKGLGSFVALQKIAFKWLFKKPAWITEEETTSLLRRYRLFVFAWNAGFPLTAGIFYYATQRY